MSEIPDSCTWARDAVSAGADDQLAITEAARLEQHLGECVACTDYAERVATLTRSTRVRPARNDPAFVARVMVNARPAQLGRGGWLRPALAWCGLLVAYHSVQPLIFGEVDGVQSHLARHAGASAAALALGLLFVAWKPHRAFGLLPLASALVALTLVGTVLDGATGVAHAWDESVHLAEVTGLVLSWMIAGSPGSDRVRDSWAVFRTRADGLRSTR
ncbi:MAG TPA: zf-HC2 domain-containing protein [Ilumatobacter sp.]|nr:zf-HC2 domain-containing protein [Ilumatobacter sp.]